ncbi:B3 domain-containing protein REM16-like isoform X1 [Rhododendron vialii]|uniref:B3 domain-containing protein REM16-like isoform X1 n=1 Tax=Rhododendron vialii TaxID=182163 RepID=UPI00265DFAEA|nr:B3 domain-containing protein REM16-like isoform X1 [Rhododendron vialii]XP_058220952.1 B3 domain-containing protein REM16-like isoform X1 [Rhododendron vialii]
MGEDCRDCSKWEQDMYWTRFQSIMFLQILPQGFDQQLDIPVKFARNMKKKLPKNVTVIGPSGAKWNVGLVASGDTLLFKHGWKEFVEDHSLKEDDVLIFKYNGDSRFDVLIFNGWSFCERESSYFVRKCKHTELDPGFQTKRNMGESESSVEVGHDSLDCGVGCSPTKKPRNNENLQSARLGRRTQARTRDGASDVMTHHGKRVVAKKVNSVAKDGSVAGYSLQYVSNRRPVTEEEKENALKMAFAASTPDSFIVVMRATHVYRKFFMSIPSEWVLSYLLHKNQDVILRVKEKENTWHANYYGTVGNSGGLVGGWKDFAVENNLEESDVCLFELASGTHDGIVMDVSIFRVVAEVSVLTLVSRSPSKRGRPTKRGRRRKSPRS